MVANHESSRHQGGVRNRYASSGAYDAYNPIIQWMSPSGQIRPWCLIAWDGSLSPDSCRPRRMPVTVASGQWTKPLAR